MGSIITRPIVLASVSKLAFWICLGGLSSLATGCTCSNTVIGEIKAPSGEFKAVVFDRNCGATTGHNLQVSVVPADANIQGGGNVLIVDDTVSIERDLTRLVSVRWNSPRQLSITLDPKLRVFLRARSVHGVNIEYLPH